LTPARSKCYPTHPGLLYVAIPGKRKEQPAMPVRMHDTERNLSAERLAQAMRSGLELRWSIPDPSGCGADPFPPFGDIRAFLEPDANSVHYHLPYRGNLFFFFIRAARCLARKIIAPWLLLQTRFNHSTIRVIEQVEQRLRALEEAELALRQTVKTLETTLLSHADRERVGQSDTREEVPCARPSRVEETRMSDAMASWRSRP
jgi:hypothetical protein